MSIADVTKMAGRFYYSRKGRKWLDSRGHPRFFCIIEGSIKEYTELISYDQITEEPTIQPMFKEDAEFLGEGFFSHTVKQ